MEKKLKICSVTGHRKIPPEKIEFVRLEMSKKVLDAIASGYNYFISGFADGTDLIFAQVVNEIKQEHNEIKLEAAIPYPRNRLVEIEKLINSCDVKHIISDHFFQGVFMKRNKYMVEQADLIIAVYDGRNTGGTFQTMQYARNREKEIQVIQI